MGKTKVELLCSRCHRNIINGLDSFTTVCGYLFCSGCFSEEDAGNQGTMVDYLDMSYVDSEKCTTV